jgi:hypothetical protein
MRVPYGVSLCQTNDTGAVVRLPLLGQRAQRGSAYSTPIPFSMDIAGIFLAAPGIPNESMRLSSSCCQPHTKRTYTGNHILQYPILISSICLSIQYLCAFGSPTAKPLCQPSLASSSCYQHLPTSPPLQMWATRPNQQSPPQPDPLPSHSYPSP